MRCNEVNAFVSCEWRIGFFFEFSQRVVELYPEIYEGGTSEGSTASNYFRKWGWYATIDELAKGNILNYKKIVKLNVHEIHLFLAHKIDKMKMKASVMKQSTNSIEI